MIGPVQISETDYHADRLGQPGGVRTLSSTVARTLLMRSPAHARHLMENPVERKTFDIGRAAHRMVLGAGADWAVIPDDLLSSTGAASTKAAREWMGDARADGLTPLKSDEADAVATMAQAVKAHLNGMGISLPPERSELAVAAPVDGVWQRALIDHAPTDPAQPLYDFKTTEDASPDAVIRAVTRYGYDVQAAFYLETWKAVTGEDRRFRFCFAEKAPPHGVTVVELFSDASDEADWMLDAYAKTAESRRIWLRCLTSNHWPCYPLGVAVVGSPAWHRQQWADRALTAPPITDAALRAAYNMQRPLEDAR